MPGAVDTKTSEPRVVFLSDRAYDIIKKAGVVRSLGHNRVFTYRGKPPQEDQAGLCSRLPESGNKQIPIL